jgi:hypothetical protein
MYSLNSICCICGDVSENLLTKFTARDYEQFRREKMAYWTRAGYGFD